MFNIGMIKLRCISDKYGNLVPIEERIDVPFEIKRIYYIYGVDGKQRRGFHSHKKLHQVLICLNGSVKIQVQNGEEKDIVELNDPSKGLYIGPLVWREMYDFSENAVLLVLASEHYDENDYIRNYDKYLEVADKLFSQKELD